MDGIDGCGKSTVLKLIQKELEKRKGLTSFDLAGHIKSTGAIPRYEDLPKAGILLSAEPTHAWTGAAIRNELISNKAAYGALETAQLFALDRHILYNRVILPALADGRIVLQDRSYLTTLVYQPVQGGITEQKILTLPGNALADEHCPGYFIQIDCSPAIAMKRLEGRSGKKDDSIFERAEVLEKLRNAFMGHWFLGYLKRKGIERIILRNDGTIEDVTAEVAKLVQKIFPNK